MVHACTTTFVLLRTPTLNHIPSPPGLTCTGQPWECGREATPGAPPAYLRAAAQVTPECLHHSISGCDAEHVYLPAPSAAQRLKWRHAKGG